MIPSYRKLVGKGVATREGERKAGRWCMDENTGSRPNRNVLRKAGLPAGTTSIFEI
jgi:hypothetical protein